MHKTHHARKRMQQRGIRESELDIVVEAASLVDADSVMLLNQDVDRGVQRRKREIAVLERLRGCRVVLAGEEVVTTYRPTRIVEKRLLRGQHRHSCSRPCR